MVFSLDALEKVMHIIVPLKINQLQQNGLNDPEYDSHRDAVRLYQTRLIEEELMRIAWVPDTPFTKSYAKALFDEYVFQRIGYDDRQVVMIHYASIIQDELRKN